MMKLKGGTREGEIRTRLKKSREGVMNSAEKEKFRNIILKKGLDLNRIFILRHVPEQDCDCYFLLCEGRKIIQFDLNQSDNEFEWNELNFEEYNSRSSKVNKLVLAVAVDELNKNSQH